MKKYDEIQQSVKNTSMIIGTYDSWHIKTNDDVNHNVCGQSALLVRF